MADRETTYDDLQRRCPRLGGPVAFHYCRSCRPEAQMCWKIIDCWWEYFDIQGYLQTCLAPEEIQALNQARTPPKLTSLVELIAKAQARERE
jgi:hypothetical protein